MDCEQARSEMLEAETARLVSVEDPSSEDGLALHVRECAACRQGIALILDGQRTLGDALDQIATRAAGAQHMAPAVRRPRKYWRLAVPAALAASAAALVLLQRGHPTPPTAPALHVPAGVVVNATGHRDVTIFKTADPNITVVWYP